MLNAREISAWFHNQRKTLSEQEKVFAYSAKQNADIANHRRKNSLEWELNEADRKINELIAYSTTLPPGHIHYRLDLTTKKRLKNQLAIFDTLEAFLGTGFNKGLLSFGSPWFTSVALLASMGLAFNWMQNQFGLDSIGGSEKITILVIVASAAVIDGIAFLLMGALMASLKNFIERERHVYILALLMGFASFIGVLGFMITLVYRFMEVRF